MTEQSKISPELKKIATKVQNILSLPIADFNDDSQKIEFDAFMKSYAPTIKNELAKITDINIINEFVKDVPAHNLPHEVFPSFVWNEISFAENIYLDTYTFSLFSEQVRSQVHIISQAIEAAGIEAQDDLHSTLIELIPADVFSNKMKVELLLGKHDCIIDLVDKTLWQDPKFVHKILFNDDVQNRESINQYSYIKILKMIPEKMMDEEFCSDVLEKFQFGYSEFPEEQKMNPDFAIRALKNHIANIEGIPKPLMENEDVVMQAVESTTILDTFEQHPYDSYHPFCHLEVLYESKMFQQLNIHNIDPLRIPGNSTEFKQVIRNEYNKLKKSLEKKKDIDPPKPKPDFALK